MKTVKELADILGVSKVTILNNAKVLELELHKKDKMFFIDEKQQEKIIEKVNANKKRNAPDPKPMTFEQSKSDHEALIKVYESQINALNERIKADTIEKENYRDIIQSLHKLLENQQILALESNKRIKELENRINQNDQETETPVMNHKVEKENTEVSEPEPIKNPSLFQRLFKSKK